MTPFHSTTPIKSFWLVNIIAITVIFTVLVIPNRLSWISLSSLLYFPLELPLIGLALLIPGNSIRFFAALILTVGAIIKIADASTYQIFDRAFNPILDAHLLVDGARLLQGIIGKSGAIVFIAGLIALAIAITLAMAKMLQYYQLLLRSSPQRYRNGLAALMTIWVLLVLAGQPRAAHYFYDLMADHINDTVVSLADLKVFKETVNQDIYTHQPADSFFEKLKGKDVLVVFIESYGRTVLDKPEFATHIRPVLTAATTALADKGFASRSAYLTSPTAGGISWLAHGTLLSGLWIDSQVRYESLLKSDRPSLNRLFKRAGWRTLAIQPAHTMAWPEGAYFGYDQVYAAADLGYRGKPFNWVTMPDQYTLSAFNTLERQPQPRQPLMAEIALISSHAPWTPVPTLIDWHDVGDGRIFNQQASAGESPEQVWQDPNRVRDHYRQSIEYALTNLVSYATTLGDDNLVILALGDHQPAPLVTGENPSREVLVHLISRDSKVMDAISDWQWTPGMLPTTDAPVWPMDTVRNRFITAFSRGDSQLSHSSDNF